MQFCAPLLAWKYTNPNNIGEGNRQSYRKIAYPSPLPQKKKKILTKFNLTPTQLITWPILKHSSNTIDISSFSWTEIPRNQASSTTSKNKKTQFCKRKSSKSTTISRKNPFEIYHKSLIIPIGLNCVIRFHPVDNLGTLQDCVKLRVLQEIEGLKIRETKEKQLFNNEEEEEEKGEEEQGRK